MRNASALAVVCGVIGLHVSSVTMAAPSDVVMALARHCSPTVSPLTMAALVAQESANRPLAINVNGNLRLPRQPTTLEEATAIIGWLSARGLNFDVGYAQINSENFARLGYRGPELLDPCVNLKAAAVVLSSCYRPAVEREGAGQQALLHALSCYNTGSQTRGFANGYVSDVVTQARILQIPALSADSAGKASSIPTVFSRDSPQETAVKPVLTSVVSSGVTLRDDRSQGAFSHRDAGAFGSLIQPKHP